MKLSSIEKEFLDSTEKNRKNGHNSHGFKYFRTFIDEFLKMEECMISVDPKSSITRIFVNTPKNTTVQIKNNKVYMEGLELYKINLMYSVIVQLLHLIEILEGERLITTYRINDNESEKFKIGNSTLSFSNSLGEMDKDISDRFIKMLGKSFVFSSEYESFSRKYKTKEEKNHLVERFLQFSGLVLAISMGVMSCISSINPIEIKHIENPVEVRLEK